jgi:hypothetical protein
MGKSGMISIACASAFWGDSAFAVPQLLRAPHLDFIAFDYLSEVTMALLARAQKKDPQAGFAADFLTDVIEPHLAECLRRRIRLISNAGGINPTALMAKIREAAARQNLNVKVACVEGDDLRGSAALPSSAQDLASANAYLGAPAVAAALAEGADVVITGRTVDSALVAGPLVHAFGWSWTDYDLLAQASLAGHIVECGTQCTGGNFTDWRRVPGQDDVGFPIVHFEAEGAFTVTKAPGTGGLVSSATVAEQIVYEIGDPRSYILPDVICDFTQVHLDETAKDEVRVSGARGRAPTPHYKVSATAQKGWRISATAFIGGGDARPKAQAIGEAILARCARLLREKKIPPFSETKLEVLGGGDEVLLRLSAAHERPEPLDVLAKEIAPAGTSLAPGVASLLGGRAHAMPRMAFSSFLVAKKDVPVFLNVDGERRSVSIPLTNGTEEASAAAERADSAAPAGLNTVKLERLAYARSGDKGNNVNIGVIARRAQDLPLIHQALTPASVAAFFARDFDRQDAAHVKRWDLPGLQALNLLLKDCLGGGGSFSLRVDPQGKTFAQRLLQMQIPVPPGFDGGSAT